MPTQEERRADSLQRIRDAALELFATQGYAETTFEDIAAKAGLSKGSIPYYFGTKRSLALKLYSTLHEELAQQEDWLLAGDGSIRDKIDRLVRHFFDWVKGSPHSFLYLFGFEITKVTKDGQPPPMKLTPSIVMERLIAEGQKTGEIRVASPTALAWSFTILVEIARHYAAGWRKAEDLDMLADEATEMVWGALRSSWGDPGEQKDLENEKGGMPKGASGSRACLS